jgi:hypothetical protein
VHETTVAPAQLTTPRPAQLTTPRPAQLTTPRPAQLTRTTRLDHLDYARFYSLTHDDGVTLTPAANQSWSLKRSCAYPRNVRLHSWPQI